MTAALSPPEEYGGKCGKTSAEIRSKFALLKNAATRKFRRSYTPMRANVSTSRKKNVGRARPMGPQSGFRRPPVRSFTRSFRRSSNWPNAAKKMRNAKCGEKNDPQQFSARLAIYFTRKGLRETARKFCARQLIGEFLLRPRIFPRSFPAAKTSGTMRETRPSAHETKIRPQLSNCRRNPRKFFPS